MQQNIAARRQMVGFGPFGLIVTEAILARDKDQCSGNLARHLVRIMTSTRNHALVRIQGNRIWISPATLRLKTS